MNKRKVSHRKNTPQRVALDKRLEHVVPQFSSFYIEEPKLVFGNGQVSVDPKAGLSEHGPVGWQNEPGKTIQIGLIGTGEGIQSFLSFLQNCQNRVTAGFNKRNKPLDPHTYPDFPGCNAGEMFRSHFVSNNNAFHRTLHEDLFTKALSASTEESRIKEIVALIVREIKALARLEPGPSVVVILLPRDVEHELAHVGAAMASRRSVASSKERFLARLMKDSKSGQGMLTLDFDTDDGKDVDGFWNIHHALKAHAMGFELPTQIIWESTLKEEQLSSVAWNLFTALYYKAGNIPWRLQLLPDNKHYSR